MARHQTRPSAEKYLPASRYSKRGSRMLADLLSGEGRASCRQVARPVEGERQLGGHSCRAWRLCARPVPKLAGPGRTDLFLWVARAVGRAASHGGRTSGYRGARSSLIIHEIHAVARTSESVSVTNLCRYPASGHAPERGPARPGTRLPEILSSGPDRVYKLPTRCVAG